MSAYCFHIRYTEVQNAAIPSTCLSTGAREYRKLAKILPEMPRRKNGHEPNRDHYGPMTASITSHGGHAYAPGFEPGVWDAFVAYFSSSSLPVEPIAALICAFALTAVMVSRAREKGRRRRRRTSLFPSTDGMQARSGGSVTLRPKARKRSLEEKRAVYDDWIA